MKHFVVGAFLLLGAGCIHAVPWRVNADGTMRQVRPHAAPPFPLIADAVNEYGDASIEDYEVRYKKDGSDVPAHFALGVIEFRDDGRFWSTAQANAVLDAIRTLAKDEAGVTVVVFAHGWHHGAAADDRDISCFRQVLGQIAIAEARLNRSGCIEGTGRSPKRRPVFGVYLAWRGESMRAASILSFYNRKSAAQTIGGAQSIWQHLLSRPAAVTDAARTIVAFDALYQRTNASGYRMSLVVVGHSFGAALVYSAVQTVLETRLQEFFTGYSPYMRGVGDLVVLVNPAFEAQRFVRLDQARRRGRDFPRQQTPVLLTIQSNADGYNLWAFTAGRLLSAWLYPPNNFGRFLRTRRAIGYYSPIRTHDLKLASKVNAETGGSSNRTCDCPWPPPQIDASAFRLGSIADQSDCRGLAAAFNVDLTDEGVYGSTALTRATGQTVLRNYPFPVVRTFQQVIPAHSDIFTPPFVEFLISYVTSSRAKRAAASRAPLPEIPLFDAPDATSGK